MMPSLTASLGTALSRSQKPHAGKSVLETARRKGPASFFLESTLDSLWQSPCWRVFSPLAFHLLDYLSSLPSSPEARTQAGGDMHRSHTPD